MFIYRSTLRTILQYTGPHIDKTTFHTVDKDDSSTSFLNKQDAYHRRKHESRIRTSTALIAREINMHELKQNSQHFS